MSKKILKALIIFVSIIIVAILVIGIRNFIVVNQILNQNIQYENVSNYYYKINLISQGTTITEMYRKGNIYVTKNARNSIWKNTETNEMIITDYATNSSQLVTEKVSGNTLPTPFNSNIKLNEKLQLTIQLKLNTKEINGKECYVIENKKQNELLYIEKDTGLLAKVKNDSMEAEYTDWKINSLTDEDVEKPII